MSRISIGVLLMVATIPSGGAFMLPRATGRNPLIAFSSAGLDPSGDVKISPSTSSKNNPSSAFGSPLDAGVVDMNKNIVGLLKGAIFDTPYYAGREYARFYTLETIARVPYFSYLAALHLYETIGKWRNANYLKLHFAESWNELHHLLIMEELGGADVWLDRFVAQHLAVGYYLFVLILYFVNPVLAYNLNQAVEEHAYHTYEEFVKVHADELKELPAPQVAKDYYADGDLYMFDAMQTGTCEPRRPVIENLYDVFCAIRDDEWEHVKTMEYLQTDMEVITSHDGICNIPDDEEEPILTTTNYETA